MLLSLLVIGEPIMRHSMQRDEDDGTPAATRSIEDFMSHEGERVRRVLIAQFGIEVGTEAWADTAVYCWENWDRLHSMQNPAGYAYRVGRSSARKYTRWNKRRSFNPVDFADVAREGTPMFEFLDRVARLTPAQRSCLILVHGHCWTYREVAEILGMSEAAVTNHVARGLRRARLEVRPR
jgi:DNA-directed RNA polymerase specialized sigma24 family protein